MTNTNREKLIERLKKLFALGQSSNQHEAEAAMAKANEIMTEYQISASDVDLSEDGPVIEEEFDPLLTREQLWTQYLLKACAKLYDADVTCIRKKYSTELRFTLYGTKADVLAAQMTFNHLYKSWQSIVAHDLRASRPANRKLFRRNHGLGFQDAIGDRIDALIAERQKDVLSATGRDLVLVKNVAVKDFLKDKKFGKGRSVSLTDEGAFMAGMERGKSIPLHASVKNESQLQIEQVRK